MSTLQQMLGQVQQLQEQLQKRLAEVSVEATAGGGLATVKMNGQKQLTELSLDPELLAHPDREMLQNLILAAVNEASRKVDAELADQLKNLAGGFPFNLSALLSR